VGQAEPEMMTETTAKLETPNETTVSTGGYRFAPHWIAVLAVIFTWPLLFVGGLVTTYRVGMAVPDWPTTFGINMFLYDMSNAAFGTFIEHGHRLYGAALGVCTILLMLDFLVFDPRKSVKVLGVLALLAVIAQGILGGIRVTNNSTFLAMVHGCTGQAFFAFMVVLMTVTAPSWFVTRVASKDTSRLKRLSVAMLVLAYSQVILGAWLRHFPSTDGLTIHMGWAFTVVGVLVALIKAAKGRKAELPGLKFPLRGLEISLAIQLILGIAAWWVLRPFDGIPKSVSTLQALLRTGHQANAALLLGASIMLVISLYGDAVGIVLSPVNKSTTSPADWSGLEVATS
jgi:cytochrome c oxidase assembly protein subunit 15